MIKGKRLSFAHLEGDICVYNLTKGDKEYIIRKTKCFLPAKRNVQKAKRNVFVLDTLPKPYKK